MHEVRGIQDQGTMMCNSFWDEATIMFLTLVYMLLILIESSDFVVYYLALAWACSCLWNMAIRAGRTVKAHTPLFIKSPARFLEELAQEAVMWAFWKTQGMTFIVTKEG